MNSIARLLSLAFIHDKEFAAVVSYEGDFNSAEVLSVENLTSISLINLERLNELTRSR